MADGSPLGIRQCEILNRTIHALAISRGRLPELRDWEEAKRSGVYFLFGKTEEGSPMVYIGEAQRVVDRVASHVREKDFWNEAVLFVNKDENMHAKYLEARLISEADKAGRYQLENGKFQELPVLSRADRSAMEEIIPDIRLILGVLGHLVFEPIDVSAPASVVINSADQAGSLVGREFVFSTSSFEANGRVTDEGFLILKGSKAAPRFTVGNLGYDRLRQKLLQDGTLKVEGEHLEFTRDYLANSSSQAAAIVAGGNRSGPESWKSGGKNLGEIEAASVAQREPSAN